MSQLASVSRPGTVLLVEDNTMNVAIATAAFRKLTIPHEIHVAVDGHDAMAFLRGVGNDADGPRPDLVLLDLNMPRMDGYEVLQEMKSDVELRSIPVIVMTTSESDTDVRRAYDRHANAYVVKPSDFLEWVQVAQTIANFWLKVVKRPSYQ